MTTVFDISMSLDGYVTAAGVRPEEPMGDGGQQLHEWALGTDERGHDALAESASTVGATIAGRRTYDLSLPWWGPDGPGGTARTPTFIVSHGTPGHVPEESVYTFVNSPIEALELASAAAGDRDVDVFSASIGRQLLRAGRIDEIRVHLVPVLFGAGTRLFEDLGGIHVQLEIIRVAEGSKATHLHYAVAAPLVRSSTVPVAVKRRVAG
jgi:dihydrofolate reductase